MRGAGVEIEGADLPTDGVQQGHIDVALGELRVRVGPFFSVFEIGVPGQRDRPGAHGSQGVEPVPVVDVEQAEDAGHGMVRVQIAVACERVVKAPGLLERIVLDHPQIMHIPAFGVEHLAEDSLADHVHEGEVAISFEPHGGPLACLLVGLDQFPGLVQSDDDGDFADGVFAILHGGHAHRGVVFPRGAADDAVERFLCAKLPEGRPAVAVEMGARLAGLLHPTLSAV